MSTPFQKAIFNFFFDNLAIKMHTFFPVFYRLYMNIENILIILGWLLIDHYCQNLCENPSFSCPLSLNFNGKIKEKLNTEIKIKFFSEYNF